MSWNKGLGVSWKPDTIKCEGGMNCEIYGGSDVTFKFGVWVLIHDYKLGVSCQSNIWAW